MGKSLFSKWCWENLTAACKSMKPEHTLTLCTKINSKWLKDINIRHDTIKLLEKNTGKTFSDINHTNGFLGQSPNRNKNKNKSMGPNQTDKLLHSKGNFRKKKKRQPTDWEKIIAKNATNKGLISKIHKQFIQFNSKNTKQSK